MYLIRKFKFVLTFLVMTCCLYFVMNNFFCKTNAQILPVKIEDESSFEFFDDGSGGIIILQSDGDCVKVINSKKSKQILQMQGSYDFALKQGKNIYLSKNDQDQSETSIICYSITKNEITSNSSYALRIVSKNDVGILKGGKFFCASSASNKNVFSFVSGKPKVSGFVLEQKIKFVKGNTSGDSIYTQDLETNQINVYDKSFSEYKQLSVFPDGDFQFLSDEIILDENKNVFVKNTDSSFDFKESIHIDEQQKLSNACVCGEYVALGLESNVVKLFSITDNVDPLIYQCEGVIKYLTSYKDKLVIVQQIDNQLFTVEVLISEIKNPIEEPQEELKEETKEKSTINNVQYLDNPEILTSTQDQEFGSESFDIDFSRHFIKNIDLGTTVSKIKKGMSFGSRQAKFIKKNKELRTGKVGTGTKLLLTDDDNQQNVFTLIVKGDVTGSGTISRLDVKEVCEHIFHNKTLEDANFEAADINGDGNVDTLDLLAINKCTS